MTSHSRFTVLPTPLVERFVTARVCGMMETWKLRSSTAATVRLMPSMQMEPFSTMYRSRSGDAEMVYQTALSSWRSSLTVPVPSICPETIWPPNRPSAGMARSRLTGLPGLRSPRELRDSVSCMTSAVK